MESRSLSTATQKRVEAAAAMLVCVNTGSPGVRTLGDTCTWTGAFLPICRWRGDDDLSILTSRSSILLARLSGRSC